VGAAPRTSCRLPIVRCALLVVNARRLYETRQREPIIPALLPRDEKWEGEKGEKEKAEDDRYANPFNRESIYITDLPNNNSVSFARWS